MYWNKLTNGRESTILRKFYEVIIKDDQMEITDTH